MKLLKDKVLPGTAWTRSTRSSTAPRPAMLAELERAYAKKEPVAVVLWSPHWAYSKYELTKLEDPKGAFGKGDAIHTLANKGFPEKFPELAGWLKNFKLSREASSPAWRRRSRTRGKGNEEEARRAPG